MRLRWLTWVVAVAGVVAMGSAPAFGQGGSTTTTLSGLVVDTSGGVIPGADVVARNNATAGESRAVTDGGGRFTIPALQPGTYTVTVSLMGFKTVSMPDVVLISATPANVRATLEVGALEETVIVEGAAELVQTQTASVSQTIAVKQIESLPLVTRTALDFVTALPSAQQAGSTSRGTIINGLPGVTINITLDGVNVQDNNNRGNVGGQNGGDGFFMYIRPMLDSVEEITVSSSTPGAESAGQGASQIRMVTRSGSNIFSASAYNTWRNAAGVKEDDTQTRNNKRGWLWRLNTPYWFNRRDLPLTKGGDQFINDVRVQTPGFRVGGPLIKDKAFYFFNWEWFLWPNEISRSRYILNKDAMRGLFAYKANDGVDRTVDLLALASANGQISTLDPIMSKLLGEIRSASEGAAGGGIAAWDLNTDRLWYSPGGEQKRHFPTLRMDVNLTPNHRLSGTVRYNRFDSSPDILNSLEPRYPGFANTGGQYSNRYMWQSQLRSTLGKSMVNELRAGWSGGTTQWYPEVAASQFACTDVGCQGGYDLNFNLNVGTNALTDATASSGPSTRFVPDLVFEDTLTWLRGKHTFNMGASYTQIKFENWGMPGGVVEEVTLGTASTDSAYSMFANASGNFPGGISSTYEGYARNLYAILTGRVSSIGSTSSFVLGTDGQYKHLGERWQMGRQNNIGLFLSDSWRVTPTLTLNAGVRYEMQTPFSPDMSTWARPDQWTDVYGISGEAGLFNPGTLGGRTPVYALFQKGDKAYNTDTNNLAPSIGLAWRAHAGDGWLGKVFGREPVLRGGYAIAYTRYGTGDFTDVYGRNPGSTKSGTRSIALGNLGAPPVLMRDASRLAPPATPGAPSYPFSPAINETVAVMDPQLKVPFTHQYSFGWQRELGKTMAMELRYVGNRFMGQWSTANLNDWGNRFLVENGFMEEFKKAQANLAANIAAGKGNTFAYTGVPGTSPLPIFLAHFAGLPQSQAGNAAAYTHANFRSSGWYNSLTAYDPDIAAITGTTTSGLQSTSFTANRLKAGLPANFWVANPDVANGAARITYNAGNTRYDGLQFDMRRRMSKGLLVQGSYTWGRSLTWTRPTLRNEPVTHLSTWNLDHSLKFNWVYEVPFGQGRRFGSGVSNWVNRIVGGWEWDGAARFQSGQVLNFNNDLANQYRLVGMSQREFADMFKLRRVQDAKGVERLYMLPEDVILNSILAISTASATSPTGYSGAVPTGKYIAPASSPACTQAYAGQCAPIDLMVRGPWIKRVDFAFVKRVEVARGKRIELRMDIFNVFDNINFIPRTGLGSSLSGWELTGAYQDINASQDPGGRISQFGLRFTW